MANSRIISPLTLRWKEPAGENIPERIEVRHLIKNYHDWVSRIVIDQQNNTVIAGSSKRALNGRNTEVSNSFVAKYSSDGQQLWLIQFGHNKRNSIADLKIDSKNHIVVTGSSEESRGKITPSIHKGFVAKYSPDGHQSWFERFEVKESDRAQIVILDQEDHVIVLGQTQGEADGRVFKQENNFVAKFTSDGQRKWIEQFEYNDIQQVTAVVSDRQNHLIVAGYTKKVYYNHKNYHCNRFLAKYSPDGHQVWFEIIKTEIRDSRIALFTDQKNNTIVAEPNGKHLAKYSTGGDELRTDQPGLNDAQAFVIDQKDNIIIAGHTEGKGHLIKYSPDGHQLWLEEFGSNVFNNVTALATDQEDNIIVTARFHVRSDDHYLIDPKTEERVSGNLFVVKFTPDGKDFWIHPIKDLSINPYDIFDLTIGEGNKIIITVPVSDHDAQSVRKKIIEGADSRFLEITPLPAKREPVLVSTRQFTEGAAHYYHEMVIDELGHLYVIGSDYAQSHPKAVLIKLSNSCNLLKQEVLAADGRKYPGSGGSQLTINEAGNLLYFGQLPTGEPTDRQVL